MKHLFNYIATLALYGFLTYSCQWTRESMLPENYLNIKKKLKNRSNHSTVSN